MRFQGAVVKEQGVTFAIVIVKRQVLQDNMTAAETASSFKSVFPGVPIILMAQDSRGVPSYWGRRDIVRFLASIPMNTIPWKEYTLN